MNKKIICILFFLLCACVGKRNEIKFLEYKNFENIENNNMVGEKIKNSKFDFRILFISSDYDDYYINDFVFETLQKKYKEQSNSKGITNIKFKKKIFQFFFFDFRYMKIEGNVIDLKKELYEK